MSTKSYDKLNRKVAEEANRIHSSYYKNSLISAMYESLCNFKNTTYSNVFKPVSSENRRIRVIPYVSQHKQRVHQIHRILIASSNKGKSLDEVMRSVTYAIQGKLDNAELYSKLKVDFPEIYRDLISDEGKHNKWYIETIMKAYYRNKERRI